MEGCRSQRRAFKYQMKSHHADDWVTVGAEDWSNYDRSEMISCRRSQTTTKRETRTTRDLSSEVNEMKGVNAWCQMEGN